MIHGELWRLTDDASLQRIADGAFHLLTRWGAEVRHETILAMLAGVDSILDQLDAAPNAEKFNEILMGLMEDF